MALKLNCLIKDTSLKADISKFIEDLAAIKIADGKSARISSLYPEVREMGIEIDAESFASMYNDSFRNVSDSRISDASEIVEFAEYEFKSMARRIGNSAKGIPPDDKNRTIGKLSPVESAVHKIMQLFDSNNYKQGGKVDGVMRKISDSLNTLVQSKLNKSRPASTTSVHDAISDFFGLEEIQNYPVVDANGNVVAYNNIETAFNELRSRMNAVVSDVIASEGLSAGDAAALRSKYDSYISELEAASYDIILSNGQQKELVKNLLSQNGLLIDGATPKDVNDNINWDMLMGASGDPSVVSGKIFDLLKNGVDDGNGNIIVYPDAYAQRIADYFERLYTQKRNDVIAARIAASSAPVKDTVSSILASFVKSTGDITLGRDNNDELARVSANWAKLINQINDGSLSIAELKNRLIDYLDKNTTFTDAQKNLILKKLEQSIAQKLRGKADKATSIEKMMALTHLNGGIAYEEQTASALLDILGVSELDQEDIDLIRKGVEAAEMVNTENVYAPINGTAIQLIQRHAKQLVINSLKRNATLQRIIRVLNSYMNTVMQSILQNGFNFLQNITSGLMNSILNTGVMFSEYGTNAWPVYVNSQKAFWNGFFSQILGGVEQVTLQDSVLGHELQTSEQYRVRQWLDLFRMGGFANIAEAVASTPSVVVGTISRILLNSFDAAMMQSNISKGVLLQTYELLKREGYTKRQINDVIASYNSDLKDGYYRDQISNAINEQVAKMEAAGIRVNAGDRALMKRDMEFSLIAESMSGNGSITKENVKDVVSFMYDNAIASAMIMFGKKRMKSTSVLSIVSNTSYKAAEMLTAPQKIAFENAEMHKEAGNNKRAALSLFAGTVSASTMGAFANGMANWFVLSYTWSPFALTTARGLRNTRKSIEMDNGISSINRKDLDDTDRAIMKKNMEFRQMERYMMARGVVSSMVIASFIAAKYMDDDEESGWYDELISKMMKTKTTRKLMNYLTPIWLSLYETLTYDGPDYSSDTGYDKDKAFEQWVSQVTLMGRDNVIPKAIKDYRMAKEDDWQDKVARVSLGVIPSAGINYQEKFNQFASAIRGGSIGEKEDYLTILKNEDAMKGIYMKQYEGIFEELSRVGAVNTLMRIGEEPRFK